MMVRLQELRQAKQDKKDNLLIADVQWQMRREAYWYSNAGRVRLMVDVLVVIILFVSIVYALETLKGVAIFTQVGITMIIGLALVVSASFLWLFWLERMMMHLVGVIAYVALILTCVVSIFILP